MANIVYNDANLKAIADAIRTIDGTSAPVPQGVAPSEVTQLNGGMTVTQMADRISELFSVLTQDEYDELAVKNPFTLYIIVEDET